jgi:hypothetical protein
VVSIFIVIFVLRNNFKTEIDMAKRKIKDIVFGSTYGDIAVQYALGKTLDDLVRPLCPDNIQTEEVDIELKVNGVEVDHEEFFKMLSEVYFKKVKSCATKMFMDNMEDFQQTLMNHATECVNDLKYKVDSAYNEYKRGIEKEWDSIHKEN